MVVVMVMVVMVMVMVMVVVTVTVTVRVRVFRGCYFFSTGGTNCSGAPSGYLST